MKTLYLGAAIAALICLFFPGRSLSAETSGPKTNPPALPAFTWDLLWSGSWEKGGRLNNRGDLRLHVPRPGLSLRGEVLDRRSGEFPPPWPWEEAAIAEANTTFLTGLYHDPTGSRLLYGVLDEWGLPARLRNPWARSVPFAENHKPSMAELKTAPVSTKDAETYLSLRSPALNFFRGKAAGTSVRGFASVLADGEWNTSFGGGLEGQFGKKAGLNLEAFYTGRKLAARKSSAWFSTAPPLPARDFALYGFGLLFTSPYLSVSSDWAYSETFAWGRDLYGNLGLRIGNPLAPLGRRWQLSLAADGAGAHYTGRDGASPGAGFRTAGKFEVKGKKSSLFRLGTTLRGSAPGEAFERSSSTVYYRFSSVSAPFRVSRISLTAGRNAQDPAKTLDSLDGTLGFTLNPRLILQGIPAVSALIWPPEHTAVKTPRKGSLWAVPVGLVLSGSLDGLLALTDEQPSPYPLPQGTYGLSSAKAAGELSWSPGIFQFKTKTAYEIRAKKDGIWDLSFSAAIHGKPGRFSFKIASPEFPQKWDFTLSWRLNAEKIAEKKKAVQ
ncbi:hypothetical protein AGMMS49546_09410 [Spirochaetia bacterium]|nr:hypothetical protein AGMMS49546_09410 [Spirochaetia bacterium]